jgi:O-antigen/teichoic acid export membrane protein
MTHSIRRQTFVAIFWTGLELCGIQLVQLVIGIILARLLLPSEFGLIGMVGVLIALSLLLIDGGFGQALIYRQNCTVKDENSIFYFNLLVGLLTAAAMVATSGPIAAFYGVPELKYICCALALDPIFNSVGLIQFTLLKKKLDYKPFAIIGFFSALISGTAGILFALYGYGVWALVIQNLVNNFLRTLLFWVIGDWRPQWIFSIASLRNLGGYSMKIFFAGLSDVIFKNLYSIILGKMYTPADLGYYVRAERLEQIPGRFVQNVISRVSFSSFSRLNANPIALKEHFRQMQRLFLLVTVPTMLGMALVARPLVVVLLTEKWLPCVPYLRLLCIASGAYMLLVLETNLLKAIGRADLFLIIDSMKKGLLVLLIIAFFNDGVSWLIAIQILVTFIALIAARIAVAQRLLYAIKEQACDVVCYAVMASIMAGAVLAIAYWGETLDDWLLLLLQCAVGGGTYFAVGIALREKMILEILGRCKKHILDIRRKRSVV